MLQQHALGLAGTGIDAASSADGVIRFDAASAVRAIVFHILDEKLARAVAPETIRRTIDRLAAKAFESSMARRRWVTLSNAQRLQWFLTESHTITVAGDADTVLLRARRTK